MYIVTSIYKTSEEDSYEYGCIGDCLDVSIDVTFKSDTLASLIEQLKSFTGHDDILLNSCDEQGRIDIQGMEDIDGCTASERDIELWKQDKLTLYCVTYTCYVYKAELSASIEGY
jgi:hypothetical protein